MEKRFYKYVFVNDSTTGTRLDVVSDAESFIKSTGPDTVKWFKGFGKCYFRHNKKIGCDIFYTQCNTNFKEYHYYDTLDDLLKSEKLTLQELPAKDQKSFYGKAHIIVDKNGINKGLKSYDELVATFESGERIRLLGYFSQTTLRHQDAYCFPNPMYFRYKSDVKKVDKKVAEKWSSLHFDI